MLKKVKILEISSDAVQKFIKHKSVLYQREGSKVSEWEMTDSHNSVHILVDNISTSELLFVKQVRIPVFIKDPSTGGEVVECCAGIIDNFKKAPEFQRAQKIAAQEVREELGYASIKQLEFIRSVKSSVGTSGTTAYMFNAVVENSSFVGTALSEDEDIITVAVPYIEVDNYMKTVVTDASTMYLVSEWLLRNKEC